MIEKIIYTLFRLLSITRKMPTLQALPRHWRVFCESNQCMDQHSLHDTSSLRLFATLTYILVVRSLKIVLL